MQSVPIPEMETADMIDRRLICMGVQNLHLCVCAVVVTSGCFIYIGHSV